MRGMGEEACLMLVGAAGEPHEVHSALESARALLRRQRAVSLGGRPGRTWLQDRFRHPYLRDALLGHGYATDTLETATSWTALRRTATRLRAAISGALEPVDERVSVLCHVSHPYRDGASLYFTFFFRCAGDVDATVERWAAVKRAATAELVECGATVSHHHGVGQWHAPWLAGEIGPDGRRLLLAAAREFDPDGCINPHVLLDPQDRLEE
jgi:alkyldihydroxyacetonephosphate synthase